MKISKYTQSKQWESKHGGFTLIEILVVIGIIAILAAVVIIAINPARQFAQARNTQRESNVNAILNAVWQRMIDNRGSWVASGPCTVAALPATATEIGSGGGGLIDLEPCLVPTYMSSMVVDPTAGTTAATDYFIMQGAGGGRITVSAPAAELGASISYSR